MIRQVSHTHARGEIAGGGDARELMRRARDAQSSWAVVPVGERLAVVRRLRHAVAEAAPDLARDIASPSRGVAMSLAAEVLPLADALKFLERRAAAALRPVRWGSRGAPRWLGGSRLEVRREPFGVVLIIGPGNYPLLLPGVQALQALVAGNAVLVKPSPGRERPVWQLRRLAIDAGLPAGLFQVLEGGAEAARAAMEAGPDKFVLTGSGETGRAVLADAAAGIVPAVVELSGCDAVFVRPDADLNLLVRGLAFGLALNGGATCIAPRRVFVPAELLPVLETLLAPLVARLPAAPAATATARRVEALVREAVALGARVLAEGAEPSEASAGADHGVEPVRPVVITGVPAAAAILREDVFAPVLSLIPTGGDEDALALDADCPYALGASVFGRPPGARRLAERIDAGTVVINDVIVPTADPRLPFGGRGLSGFGVTRGLEGLVEMTRPKAITARPGRFRPHFDPPRAGDDLLFARYLLAAHGRTLWQRAVAASAVLRALAGRSRRAAGEGPSPDVALADPRETKPQSQRPTDERIRTTA